MAEALEEIVVAKRQRYEDWRHRHLSTPFLTRVQRRILRFVVASALPAAAVAFAAHHNFDRSKMAGAIKDGGKSLRKKVLGERSSTQAAAAPAALEAAPVAAAAPAKGSTGAAAALKEAEVALRAAEAAQKAALDELQRTSKPQQKKQGWF
jgi:hypothetical protein